MILPTATVAARLWAALPFIRTHPTTNAPHRATPELWNRLQQVIDEGHGDLTDSLVLDLRARVLALEALPAPQEVFVQRPPDPALRDFVVHLNERVEALEAAQQQTQPAPPADGEVAELVAELQSMATDADRRCRFSNAERLSRAAELLQRQVLVPVPEVDE